MTPQEYSITKSDAPIDATMRANLTPISYESVVPHAAIGQDTDKITDSNVRSYARKGSHNDSGTHLYIMTDVRQWVNQISESPASFEYGAIEFDFLMWISDCSNKDITFLDYVIVYVAQDL
jgi:hypothetical protein